MYCKNCGSELKEDAKFCTKCGEGVKNDVLTQRKEERNKVSHEKVVKRLAIALFATLFIAIFIWIVIPFIRQVHFLKKGKEALEQQNYAQVILSYGQALRVVPDSKFVTDKVLEAGTQCVEDDMFQGAVTCFDVVLTYDDTNQEAFEGKVTAYMTWAEQEYNYGKAKESIELYKDVIELKPEDEEAYIKIADIFLENNDVIKSIEMLDKGLESCVVTEEIEALKGSILENTVITGKESYDNNKQLFAKTVYEYDEDGTLLKETAYDPEKISYISEYVYDEFGNVITYKNYMAFVDSWLLSNNIYDERGNLIKEESIDEGGKIIYSALHNYDSQNKKVSMVEYGADGTVTLRENYKYDDEGRRLELIRYRYENEFQFVEMYEYENISNGRLLQMIRYDASNAIQGLTVYEYQNGGNKVVCTIYGQDGGRFISRTIHEYDEDGKVMKYTYEDGKTSEHEYSYNVLGDVIKEITTYTDDGAGVKDVSENSYEYQYLYISEESRANELEDKLEDKEEEAIFETKEVIDKEIHINNNMLDVMVGDNINLEVTFVPEDTSNKSIVWTSSNNDIISIAQNGTIYAVGKGEATITAVSNSGNTAELVIDVKERCYTVDNLPDGIFIKKDGLFYPLTLGMPEGYNNSATNYFWTEASNYDPSDFSTLQSGDVIAYKGPIESKNIGCILVEQIPLYGYVLNALNGQSLSYARDFYDFDGNPICSSVKFIDDTAVCSMYGLRKITGWTCASTMNANFGLIFGDFEKDERHTIGYFEGTAYCEKELVADKWGASLHNGIGYSEWYEIFNFEATRNGYFETTLKLPKAGLYVLKFKEYSSSLFPYYDWATLVWGEK